LEIYEAKTELYVCTKKGMLMIIRKSFRFYQLLRTVIKEKILIYFNIWEKRSLLT